MQRSSDATEVLRQLGASTTGAFFLDPFTTGVIRITGRDTLDLMNRLTTNKVDTLRIGEVRETLVTTEKGRVTDAVLILPVDDEHVLLLVGEDTAQQLITWLEKYTIMEDCRYEDVSEHWGCVSVLQIPKDGIDGLPSVVEGRSMRTVLAGIEVQLLRFTSVTGDALRLLCSREEVAGVQSYLAERCLLPPVGKQAFTLWRVDKLVPAVGHELSGYANPLESGGSEAVDFEKGCYIGQEVIARLDSYDKVQRHPRRLLWPDGAPEVLPVATDLTVDGRNAGFVTTHVHDPRIGLFRGIGLIRIAYLDTDTVLQCMHEGREYRVRITG
jgi:folate-binding protein YgfZ